MKRNFLYVVLIAAIGIVAPLTVGAEMTTDPNHPVYRALDRWIARGLVEQVPVIQPYSLTELETLLGDVIRRGSPQERTEAQRFLDEITPQGEGSIYGSPFMDVRLYTRDDEIQPKATAGIEGGGRLTDALSFGGSFSGWLIERGAEDLVPSGIRATEDVLEDNAKVTVRGRDIYTLLQINTQTTLEWENLSIRAGIHRRSYGPFHEESPVLSRYAPQAGNAILQYDIGPLRYTASLSSHTAVARFQKIDDPDHSLNTDVDQDGTDDFKAQALEVPGKKLFIQSFGFRPAKWFEFSFFEAVVFGPRTELNYLLPLKFLWHAQGNAAFADNSFIGLSADIRPTPGLRIPLMVYVDDAGFNDIATFNFDTKYLMATASAIQWAPEGSWQPMFEASYEAVLPYMYTHAATNPYTTEPNYLTYMHHETSIGNGLLPNSDRARLTASAAPASWLRLEATGTIIRHANASEGELDQFLNDGGYYDAGRDGDFDNNTNTDYFWAPGDLVYNETFGFLTQDHLERRYQAGLRGDLTVPVGKSALHLGLGYTYEYVRRPIEYVWTDDAASDGGGGYTTYTDDEVNHYSNFSLRYTY